VTCVLHVARLRHRARLRVALLGLLLELLLELLGLLRLLCHALTPLCRHTHVECVE
jgi:hypothetical protein